jgi:peptidoglycan/LPS O-acetylase OafA/YrhL
MAAFAVVLTHIPRQHHGEFDWLFFAFLPLDFGALGVALFIVLSGFCIHLGVARGGASGSAVRLNWLEFWKRRFVRLYPAYVGAIVFSLAAYSTLLAFGRLPARRVMESAWTDLVIHLAMLQNVTPEYLSGLYNPAFWTLALEEQLYALFALVLVLRRRVPVTRVLLLALAVTLIWRIGGVWVQFTLSFYFDIARDAQVIAIPGVPAIGSWGTWAPAWWFLWVLGAVAAEAHAGIIRLPEWCYSWRVALGAAGACVPTYFRTLGVYTTYFLNDDSDRWLRVSLETIGVLSEVAFGLACFIVLNSWCRAERQQRFTGSWIRPAAAVGLFSYSLYLVHFPVIGMLEAFLPIGDRQSFAHAPLRVLVYSTICIAVAYAFFVLVERRFLTRSKPKPLARVAPSVDPREAARRVPQGPAYYADPR